IFQPPGESADASPEGERRAGAGWARRAIRAIYDLAARLRHDAEVRARGLPTFRIGFAGRFVTDRASDDHILALLPVHRRRYFVVRSELEGVDHAQHLVEVAASGHWIDENELDLLVG